MAPEPVGRAGRAPVLAETVEMVAAAVSAAAAAAARVLSIPMGSLRRWWCAPAVVAVALPAVPLVEMVRRRRRPRAEATDWLALTVTKEAQEAEAEPPALRPARGALVGALRALARMGRRDRRLGRRWRFVAHDRWRRGWWRHRWWRWRGWLRRKRSGRCLGRWVGRLDCGEHRGLGGDFDGYQLFHQPHDRNRIGRRCWHCRRRRGSRLHLMGSQPTSPRLRKSTSLNRVVTHAGERR